VMSGEGLTTRRKMDRSPSRFRVTVIHFDRLYQLSIFDCIDEVVGYAAEDLCREGFCEITIISTTSQEKTMASELMT
jgi:hypothetical protein